MVSAPEERNIGRRREIMFTHRPRDEEQQSIYLISDGEEKCFEKEKTN